MLKKPHCLVFGLNLLLILLGQGCSNQTTVQGAYATPKQTPAITAAGVTSGAAIGALTGGVGGAAIGATVGGAAGAGLGSVGDSRKNFAEKLNAQGVQVIILGDTLRAIVYSDNCFEQGTAEILTSCQPILNDLSALLKTYGNTSIKVSAYTDNVREQVSAKFLSTAQAQSLGAYLWTHGIPFRQITTIGYGRLDPIASNGNVLGSAMNRRVEISLSAI